MKRQYRIVRDRYCGYEVQSRTWWWPFWSMVGFCNTHTTIEAAEKFAIGCAKAKEVVKDLGWKP